MVAANHFWLPVANKIGAHPVTAFYMISGYLMTLTIHQTYGLSPRGVARFLVNRALRIFPAYWTVLATSVVLLYLSPNFFGNTYSTMQLPKTAWSWMQNIFLLDLSNSETVISPPAWTLTIEFFFYIAMPLLLARTKITALVWLIISFVYTICLVKLGAPFSARYAPVTAASLFFAVGSNMRFLQPAWRPPVWLSLSLVPVFVVFPLLVEWAGGDRLLLGFYGGAALAFLILLGILPLRIEALRTADKIAGDLAYPVFLSHVMAAGMVRMIATNLSPGSFEFLVFMLLLSLTLSSVWIWIEYRYIAPIRDNMRGYSRNSVAELSLHGERKTQPARQKLL